MDRINLKPALKSALTLAVTAWIGSVAYSSAIQPFYALFQPKLVVSSSSVRDIFWWSGLHWKPGTSDGAFDLVQASTTPENKFQPNKIFHILPEPVLVASHKVISKDLIKLDQAKSAIIVEPALSEAEKMLRMHRSLRQAFHLAMNTQPSPQIVPAFVATSEEDEMIEVVKEVKAMRPHKSKAYSRAPGAIAAFDRPAPVEKFIYRYIESLGLPVTQFTPGVTIPLVADAEKIMSTQAASLATQGTVDKDGTVTLIGGASSSHVGGTPAKIVIKKLFETAKNDSPPAALPEPQKPIDPLVPILPPEPPTPNGPCGFDQGYDAPSTKRTLLSTQCETVIGDGVSTHEWKKMSTQSNIDYLPTLYLGDSAMTEVPMLSKNGLGILAKYSHAQLSSESAVIYGKIAGNWNIEISNRAEQVLYFDEAGNLLAGSDKQVDQPRYFLFLNVSPGQTLASIYSATSTERTGVLTPLFRGQTTYLDLTHLTRLKIKGRVFDATSAKLSGAQEVAVKIMGQPHLGKTTNSEGFFQFDEVIQLGNYPLFAETESTDGYKHRQRLRSEDGYSLYRFANSTVQDWIKQLQGGVQAESGLVIASTLQPVLDHSEETLFPVVETLDPSSSLRPETYALGLKDEMLTQQPLSEALNRFVAVQIPEGPTRAALEDSKGHRIWSELFFSSPAVVSVLGPYTP